MGRPNSKDAILFYRCAVQRFEEAQVLNEAGFRTGAVYLAGYGIECILKALVLAVVPAKGRAELLKSFRGARAHDYNWLRDKYLKSGGATFPREVTRHFALVNTWSTDLRYSPRQVGAREAETFLEATEAIMNWAKGRL